MPIRKVRRSPAIPSSPSSAGGDAREKHAPRRRVRPAPGAQRSHDAQKIESDAPSAHPDSSGYEVGRGKPPVHSRFRKGVSGNPRGRPPGAKGLKKLVRENLLARVPVRTEAGTRKVTRIEAIILKQLEQAVKGNQRAAIQLMSLYAAAVPDLPDAQENARSEPLTRTDEAILAQFRDTILSGSGEE